MVEKSNNQQDENERKRRGKWLRMCVREGRGQLCEIPYGQVPCLASRRRPFSPAWNAPTIHYQQINQPASQSINQSINSINPSIHGHETIVCPSTLVISPTAQLMLCICHFFLYFPAFLFASSPGNEEIKSPQACPSQPLSPSLASVVSMPSVSAQGSE